MTPSDFFEHFATLADAPGGIPRLRELILQLAIQGKLAPQDPTDEPAERLLEKITADHSNGNGNGAAPKNCTEADPGEEEILFAIPDSWRWTRIGRVCHDWGQAIPATEFTYIDVSAINNEKGVISEEARRLAESEAPSRARKIVKQGTVIYCTVRPYLRNIAIVTQAYKPSPIASTAFSVLHPYDGVLPEFVFRYLRSAPFCDYVTRFAKGVAYPAVGDKAVHDAPFPLPPLAEQKRIVAKVDRLMALCDALEAQQQARRAVRSRLHATLLGNLQTAANAADFARAWQRLRDHFAELFTPGEAALDAVAQLRQTILQLAVQGKLLPQDPNDEPATELLAKDTKLPEGHHRRRKILKKTAVNAPEGLFSAIPSSWEYTDIQTLYDLNAIIDYADGNHGSLYPRKSEFGDSGVTFVTAKDLAKGLVTWDRCSKLRGDRAIQLTKGWAQGGDVLLTHNATVGRVAQVEPEVGRFLLGTSVTFYRLNSEVLYPRFFFYLLQSSLWQGQLEAIMAQTTRNQVSIQKQAYFRVVVPPFAEQQRIVAKVQQLMVQCDALEASLKEAATVSERWSAAAVRHLLGAAND